MRINNPKTIATFSNNQNFEEESFKLATIRQLKAQVDTLSQRFFDVLAGIPNQANPNVRPGAPGFEIKSGYAWLNEHGKIDKSLLPAIKNSQEYKIPQSYFVNDQLSQSPFSLIKIWMTDYNSENGGGHLNIRKYDTIIIFPDNGSLPNLNIVGTYLVENAPADKTHIEEYSFVKLIDYENFVTQEQFTTLHESILNLTAIIENHIEAIEEIQHQLETLQNSIQ